MRLLDQTFNQGQLYAYIRQDARHHNLLTFANKPVAARAFPEWVMGFHALTALQFEQVMGYLGPPQVSVSLAGFADKDRHLFDLLRAFVLP